MKTIIFIPLALLTGMLIGSWSPRSEIASLTDELKTARELLKHQPRKARTINQVTSLLGIERAGDTPTSSVTPAADDIQDADGVITRSADGEDIFVAVAGTNAEAVVSSEQDAEPREDARPPEDMGDEIDRAVELWQMRVNVARSTFASNVRLSEEQAMQFDLLVQGMNVRIGATIDNFAANLQDAEEVQIEAGIRLMNEISDSIILTYDEMEAIMPDDWRRKSGESFSLMDFIDPEVGRPLIGVEDKLDGINGPHE